MARIAFLLLCHKDVAGIIAQAQRLSATGEFVAIHFDGQSPDADFARLRAALAGNPRVTLTRRRHRCGWGEWSLVAATIEAARTALDAFPQASHLYLLSGDCMPVKSALYARDVLDAEDCDHIETVDFLDSDWIKTGIKEERLIYRHWFNERSQSGLFYRSLHWQRRLNLARTTPKGLRMMIGSQWWCLRRETVERILAFCAQRRDVMRFFATTWIPDETFFQTLVAHLVPRTQVRARTLTFLMFTDYGMPVTFHDDHFDLLIGQDFLFARKISAEAQELRARLGDLWGSDRRDFAVDGGGPRLHRFLTGQGRVGRRFAPRAWEAGAEVGRGRTLHVILAKKWHLAKRLTAAIRDHTPVPAVDYVFHEAEAQLPDLGGLGSDVAKRTLHRRAFLRLVCEQLGGDRLVLCLDPASQDVLTDLAADRADLRVLLMETEFPDDWMRGHVGRIGLAAPHAPEPVLTALIPAVRRDLAAEIDHLQDMALPWFERISATRDPSENAATLARFLDLPPVIAQTLAETPHLFAD